MSPRRIIEEVEEEEGEFEEVIELIFNRPEVQHLVDKFSRILDRATGLVDGLGRHGEPKPSPGPRQERQERPARPAPKPPKEDPRVVLGFSPTAKLTPALVKERKRALARLFHPDTQGSTTAMQRVNTAADELLKTLK